MLKRALAAGLVLLMMAGGAWAVSAQEDGPFANSSCEPPAEGSDVFICPENTLTNGNGSFVIPSIYVRDERYGWLRLTPCDGVIVECENLYIRADVEAQGSAIEIALDDPGDGEPQS